MSCRVLFVAATMTALTGIALGGGLAPPPFDPQRDIFWSFDPGSQPPLYDPVYSGPDDPYLEDRDMIVGGNCGLLDIGTLGLINNDPDPTSGMIRVQIGNWDRPNYAKKIRVCSTTATRTRAPS